MIFSPLKNRALKVLGAGITKSGTVIRSPIIFTGVVNNWLSDTGSSSLLSDDNTYRVRSKEDWLSSAKQGS